MRLSAPPTRAEHDVCIVGSGPAGLVLARELQDSGLRVLVVESGVETATARGNRLRAVTSEGIRIKPFSRERVFGGASTTWAGLSSPLDAIDLTAREWVPLSGWPIAPEELQSGYSRAAELHGFASPNQLRLDGPLAGLRSKGDWHPRWDRIEEKLFLAAAPAQNFAALHGSIFAGKSADLLLDTSVVRLETERSSGRVQRAVFRRSDGTEGAIHAGTFVLATGGIENARLLLLSRDACDRGLGNEQDQVGRCLMNHPKNYCGELTFSEPLRSLPYFFGCMHAGFSGYGGLRLAEAFQRERRVLNSYVRMEPLFPWSDSRGVEALVTLAKRNRLLIGSVQRQGRRGTVELRDYAETGDDSVFQEELRASVLLGHVLQDLPDVLRYAWSRTVSRRKPRIQAARLRNFMEMQPDPENRVLLDERLDEQGVPLPLVRHTVSELDRRSLLELHRQLGEELRANGARLTSPLAQASPWPVDADASHHMGTTRMGHDPRTSVVTPDLRVHGVPNLYCAGASVFPTSGCANPTYTIAALSIRLARHLTREACS